MSLAMIRFISPLVTVLACTLCAGSVRAQVSDADLVTRIGRLEATIRELTGHVEQLQYRNQQLEQQVQHLQEEATRGEEGRGPPRAASSATQRPAAQNPSPPYSQPPYSPPPYSPPPVGAPPAPPAPVEPPPPSSGGRRGDAFDPSSNPTAPGVP